MIRATAFVSFLILTIAIFVSEVKAQTYHNGYFDRTDNVIFFNNYWYHPQDTGYLNPYIRTRYQNQGYYANGCWVPGNYYNSYTKAYLSTYTPPVATTYPTVKDADWRTQLLKVAEQRDKYNGQIQKEALEHAQYMEAVKALGLPGPIPSAGNYAGFYGSGLGYGGYGNGYSIQGNYSSYPLYGVNASTVYGYSYNNLAQLYKDTDINQLYLQAAQLTAGAQKLAGDANVQFGGLVAQEGGNRARVAEILAKSALISQVLQSLQAPPPVPEMKSLNFSIQPGGKIQKDDSKASSSDKERIQAALGDLLANKCSDCHYGKVTKGGFSIENFFSLSQDEKNKRIYPRIFTNDSKIVMPRNKDGSAGTPLTDSEKQLFLAN